MIPLFFANFQFILIHTSFEQNPLIYNELCKAITSYLGPPVVTVFVMGIFVPFTNEPGAFWGLITGLVIGCFRMINEFALPAPRCGFPDPRPLFILRLLISNLVFDSNFSSYILDIFL